MDIAIAMQWVFAYAVAKITPLMIATLAKNGYGTFLMYGSFCFCAGVFAFFCIPETKCEFFYGKKVGKCCQHAFFFLNQGLSPEAMDELSQGKKPEFPNKSANEPSVEMVEDVTSKRVEAGDIC